jgi:hypothetical protein
MSILTDLEAQLLRTLPSEGWRYLMPSEEDTAEGLHQCHLIWTASSVVPRAGSSWATLKLARHTYEGRCALALNDAAPWRTP